MFTLPWKLILELLAVTAILTAIGYAFHTFCEHEREIGRNEIRVADAQAFAAQKAASDKETASLTAQRDAALAAGVNREKLINNLSASSTATVGSLRDTIATISRGVPSDTIETLRTTVTTLSSVFGDCTTKYRAMAETADRHANDQKTLSDAYPTALPPK